MLFYGVLMLAQKTASQFGDGEGALAMWKNSLSDYHDEHKVGVEIEIKLLLDHI